MENYAECVEDEYRCILAFNTPISEITLHLYISALTFSPRVSNITHRTRPYFPRIFSVMGNADEEWSAWLRNIHTMPASTLLHSPLTFAALPLVRMTRL